MTFTCQCQNDKFVEVRRFQTDGRVLPSQHGVKDGNRPMIECTVCHTLYAYDIESHTWEEVTV